MITVEYEPTEAELARAFRLTRSRHVVAWLVVIVAILLGALGLLVGLLFLGALLVVAAVALLWLLLLEIPRIERSDRRKALMLTRIVVTDDMITVTTPGREREVPWSSVQTVRENPYAWKVTARPKNVGTVLKRAMDDEQRAEFTALVAMNVRGKNVKWRDDPERPVKVKRTPTRIR